MIDMVTSNKTEVVVKQATSDDIPNILDVAKATWEPTYREILSKTQIDFMYDEIYTPASLENQMSEQEHTFLILYKGDLPAGYASFGFKSNGDKKFINCTNSISGPNYREVVMVVSCLLPWRKKYGTSALPHWS